MSNLSTTARAVLRRPEGPVLLAAAGATMAQTRLLPGLLVADVALGLAMLWAVAILWATRTRPRFPGWGWLLVALAAWAAIAAAFLAQVSPLPFSAAEWAKSFAKLCFYAAAVLCLAQTAPSISRRRLAEGLLWIVAVNGLVGLYVYAVMASGAPLPYRFLWAGTGEGDETALFVRAGQQFLRLRGLAAEPSYFGYFQVLALAASLLLRPVVDRRRWRLPVAVLAIVLTFSLTTYALAAVSVVVLAVARRKELAPQLPRWALLAAACLLLVAALPAPRRALSEMIVQRGVDVVSGDSLPLESSRLVGTWESLRLLWGASPVLGVGLGNYDVALEGVAHRLDPTLGSRHSQGWNVLAYVAATLGTPGLLLLLALLGLLARHSPAGGLLLSAATFADGTWLGAPFWLAFLLFWLGAAMADREAAPATTASATKPPAATARAHQGSSSPR